MGYIAFGLTAVIAGVLLFLGSDSPATMERSEVVGLLLLVAGVVLVLVGMVTHVVAVTRADRRRQ
jgi:drug/metabolite transporter (DMT)-like permease